MICFWNAKYRFLQAELTYCQVYSICPLVSRYRLSSVPLVIGRTAGEARGQEWLSETLNADSGSVLLTIVFVSLT